MTNSRVALLAVGTALMGAWLSSASSTSPFPPDEPQVGSLVMPPPAAESHVRLDLDHEVSRLTARIETAPRPRSPGRNPFTLGRRSRAEGPRDVATLGTLVPVEISEAPPAVVGWESTAMPSITLAGVGAERTPTGLRHTAVLASDGRVFLSHVGDEVMGRYQVRAVTAETASLLDRETGASLHLALP